MVSRRKFIKYSLAAGIGSYLTAESATFRKALAAARPRIRGALSTQVPLAGTLVPKFVDPLPGLEAIFAGEGEIELHMREFEANVLSTGTPGYLGTHVWGYLQKDQYERATYLGPVVVATRGTPTQMKFYNDLGHVTNTQVQAYKFSTDRTLHWADPEMEGGMPNMYNHMAMPPAFNSRGADNYGGPIPAVVHLHGGEVPPTLDGGPDAWITSDGFRTGSGFYTKPSLESGNYHTYRYPNSQEAAPIWFHDHTMGATRLNVYCGLAGGYLIVDPANDPQNLPGVVPLVIQDRMFDTTGELFFPAASAGGILWALNPEHPYWVPEFLGDVICVNGKSWPYMNVEPKRYRFLFLNGSNARAYEMFLADPVSGNPGPRMYVIGTDGGYLDKPVMLNGSTSKLVMLSGERYQVMIDFKGFEAGVIGPNGTPYSGKWHLKNTAKSPYPAGAAVWGNTTGMIMQFNMVPLSIPDTSFNPAAPGATLRGGAGQGPAIIRLVDPAKGTLAAAATTPTKTRQLTLNEVMGMPQTATDPVTGNLVAYPGGPLEILVNNTKFSGSFIDGVDDTDPDMPMYHHGTRNDFTPITTGGETRYISEYPNEGETEVWEIVNLTADAHPIHLHLVQFQLMNRQAFDVGKYGAAYAAAFPGGGYDHMTKGPHPAGVYIPGFGPPLNYNPSTASGGKFGGNPDVAAAGAKGKLLYLKGSPTPPLPHEAGWKDTVIVLPGQVTRIVVRWGPTDKDQNAPASTVTFPFDPAALGYGYVWHCHIVDHEDNEMMRPDQVNPNTSATRTFIQGEHY